MLKSCCNGFQEQLITIQLLCRWQHMLRFLLKQNIIKTNHQPNILNTFESSPSSCKPTHAGNWRTPCSHAPHNTIFLLYSPFHPLFFISFIKPGNDQASHCPEAESLAIQVQGTVRKNHIYIYICVYIYTEAQHTEIIIYCTKLRMSAGYYDFSSRHLPLWKNPHSGSSNLAVLSIKL